MISSPNYSKKPFTIKDLSKPEIETGESVSSTNISKSRYFTSGSSYEDSGTTLMENEINNSSVTQGLTLNSESIPVSTKTKSLPSSASSSSSSSRKIDQTIKNSPSGMFLVLHQADSLTLNESNSYDLRFSTGIMKGRGEPELQINPAGNTLTFVHEGSYRFDFYGEIDNPLGVDVELVYHSLNQSKSQSTLIASSDMDLLTRLVLPSMRRNIWVQGLATIIPIHRGQQYKIQLVPRNKETLVLLSGARVIVTRVI